MTNDKQTRAEGGGMKDKDDIGDRFKGYESVFDYSLPRRLPMVIRVDGRAFHGLKLDKPFDAFFFGRMGCVATALCVGIQGAILAYFQSDEISIIVRDDVSLQSQPWLGKRLSKVLSLSAAIATAEFNDGSNYGLRQFDSRAFVVPDLSEVINYLIWRQQDATRNSVSMAARAVFSHKQCTNKTTPDMRQMLEDAGKKWEETPTHFKRGAVCYPFLVEKPVEQTGETCLRREWRVDYECPIFTQDRGYIEALYKQPEDKS